MVNSSVFFDLKGCSRLFSGKGRREERGVEGVYLRNGICVQNPRVFQDLRPENQLLVLDRMAAGDEDSFFQISHRRAGRDVLVDLVDAVERADDVRSGADGQLGGVGHDGNAQPCVEKRSGQACRMNVEVEYC
jgi:hypothetical protein